MEKFLSRDDCKDDRNAFLRYCLVQVVAMEVDAMEVKRESKKRELQEDGEWERVGVIPKRKRSERKRRVSPIPPPKLDTESEETKPPCTIPPPKPEPKTRRRPCTIPPPCFPNNLTVLENVKEKPKAKRIKKQKPDCPNPPPDLPDNLRRHIVETMGGSGLVLVIQKPLFFSDVNRSASRFSIPFSQIATHDFLNETEVKALDEKNKMQVSLLDPSMVQTTHTFKKWVMNNNSLYVMTKPWNDVVKTNGLKEDDIVQLWSFRVDSKLFFALVKLQVQAVNIE